MAGPIESVKALWNDRKKRPWLIGGVGVAAGAGVLAMRRQGEAPAEGEEDAAAAVEGAPTSLDAAAAGDPYAAGTLPALVYVGGDGQGQSDPAFDEMDLSGVFAEIDGLREETLGEIDEQVRAGTGGLRARARRTERSLKLQTAKNKRQHKRIGRLERRVKRVSKRRPPPKPKAKKKPARKRPPRKRVRR